MRLLEPIKVGKIELKNRVMFPPMTTGYEGRDGTIVEQSFNFYKRLAEGGVSYIVLGDVAPVNTISPTPKLFHDGQIHIFNLGMVDIFNFQMHKRTPFYCCFYHNIVCFIIQ